MLHRKEDPSEIEEAPPNRHRGNGEFREKVAKVDDLDAGSVSRKSASPSGHREFSKNPNPRQKREFRSDWSPASPSKFSSSKYKPKNREEGAREDKKFDKNPNKFKTDSSASFNKEKPYGKKKPFGGFKKKTFTSRRPS